MATHVADLLALPNLGTQPEPSNRLGGLYIRYWRAPSALIEIAYLQADAALLRDRLGVVPYLFAFFRVHYSRAVEREIVTTDPGETPLIYPQAILNWQSRHTKSGR